MSIEQEIRDEIDNIKQLKIDVGDINNHLNALEGLCRDCNQKAVDDAYKRGYEKGRKVGIKDGMCDAWEAAKKIALMDTETSENVTGYFGLFRIMENLTPMQAIEKLKAYEEKQKADDEIKVGDEVISLKANGEVLEDMSPWIVTYETKYSYQGFEAGGMFHKNPKDSVRKTGRHFDIEKILEAMKK